MKHVVVFSLIAALIGMFLGWPQAMAQPPKVKGGKALQGQSKVGVIVVDVQGDFTQMKKGSLAVPGTDRAFLEKVRKATSSLAKAGLTLYATQDWHPPDHISFFTNHPGKKAFDVVKVGAKDQVLWPPHCVQGTEGARVLVDNNLFLAIVKKGQDKNFDSYSGFQDDGGAKTEMERILKARGIKKLIIYGIATDYCVKATALDAVAAGFEVTVVEELCRGVAPETTAKALQEMKSKGITVIKTLDLATIKGL